MKKISTCNMYRRGLDSFKVNNMSPNSLQEFEDETLAERLWGLTEMFPPSVCNGVSMLTSASLKGVQVSYNFSRSALWIGTTTFMVLILPVIFETEMAQMEQAQLQKQRQVCPEILKGAACALKITETKSLKLILLVQSTLIIPRSMVLATLPL